MKIIVGLGNPGAEYQATRHNAGVMLVDKLAESLQSDYGWRKLYDAWVFKTEDFWLVKPKEVFMNESGKLLNGLFGQTSPSIPLLSSGEGSNLYVAHDDLDIKLGEYKIQRGKGPKVHNGVSAVESTLGTKDFWRIRIGIDNRTTPIEGETYVLQKFTREEKLVLNKVLEEIISSLNITP